LTGAKQPPGPADPQYCSLALGKPACGESSPGAMQQVSAGMTPAASTHSLQAAPPGKAIVKRSTAAASYGDSVGGA